MPAGVHLVAGAGRAGKPGCLSGSRGSKYLGQVLAGRPHGKGEYFAQVSRMASSIDYEIKQLWPAVMYVLNAPYGHTSHLPRPALWQEGSVTAASYLSLVLSVTGPAMTGQD